MKAEEQPLTPIQTIITETLVPWIRPSLPQVAEPPSKSLPLLSQEPSSGLHRSDGSLKTNRLRLTIRTFQSFNLRTTKDLGWETASFAGQPLAAPDVIMCDGTFWVNKKSLPTSLSQ